jgi:hypothetical protein
MNRRSAKRRIATIAVAVGLGVACSKSDGPPPPPKPDVITRVSVSSSGAQGEYRCSWPSISSTGRYVAFESSSTTLVPGDTNGRWDIFVHDRETATTARASVASDGTESNGESYYAHIDPSGRFVAFQSTATNLVPGDTNGSGDVFVHDLQSGATVRVSVASNGTQGNWFSYLDSRDSAFSATGRYVVYHSFATTLVPGDTNGRFDVFVHDRDADADGIFDESGAVATVRVSVASDGTQGNDDSYYGSMSADGRFVAFQSLASNLAPGDSGSSRDVFVHDRDTDGDGVFDEAGAIATTLVSVSSSGTHADADCFSGNISADGRYVVFRSAATNLVAGDVNGLADMFVRDLETGATVRVSVGDGEEESNGDSTYPAISATGRYVAFQSSATNLVAGDTNGVTDVFVRDLDAGTTSRVSVDAHGVEANASSAVPAITADGAHVAFESGASNLVAGDTNGWEDVFVAPVR